MCQHLLTSVVAFEMVNFVRLLSMAELHFLAGEPYTALASLVADSLQEIILLTEHPPEITETFVCSGFRKLLSHFL